jgi:hypothetical protein
MSALTFSHCVVPASVLVTALIAASGAGCVASASSAPRATSDAGPDAHASLDASADVPDAGSQVTPPVIPDAVFAALKTGADAQTDLCADSDPLHHPNFPADADVFLRVFCVPNPPVPHSLADLEKLLGLGFADPNGANGAGGNPAFVLTGHSSSLVGRFVSAINPRAILFTPPPADGSKPSGYVALAFSRGDGFAEVVAHDPAVDQVILYLVRFQSRCTGAQGACLPGDVLLPAGETSWLSVTSYESTALDDTVLDCKQCHQPSYSNGYGQTILRMQESSAPYTHFFSAATAGGAALLADFHAAHGTTEDYGGIPAAMIDKSDPSLLQRFVQQAGFSQPNAFDSTAIEAEVRASAPGQPADNVPPGASSTWNGIYDQAVHGDAIAVPYHDVKVTDPGKLASATSLYQSVAQGRTAANALTDIRDVFLDEGIRDMGFAPKAGLSAPDLFVQVCGQCHNGRLDTQLSRGNFNADLLVSGQLRPAEKGVAVARLSIIDPQNPSMMPPPVLRTLTADERQRMIDYLQQ